MSERIVNLDNTPRSAVTLQIAGVSFVIRRVVTGAQQLWAAFVRESKEYVDKVLEYLKATAGKMPPEELARRTEELAGEVDAFAARKLERYLGIIELLLTRNGYGFQRQWWIDNAGEDDYREFIGAAIVKDHEGGKKNGEDAEGSGGTA